MHRLTLDRFVLSSCSNPELNLEDILPRYADLGFRKFEAFTSWATSALDVGADPDAYRALAERHGIRFTSMHLPPVGDARAATLGRAVAAAEFAQRLGAGVVLFKATSRENYIASARPFLDATAHLGLTPVLQNHVGTPISTLDDFRVVLAGIADPRMRTLLEVGHFHTAGVRWPEGWEVVGDRVALVHIKDQVGPKPVPFGDGEVDLVGLFRHLQGVGYAGDIVVEMEAAPRDTARTLQLLRDARAYLQRALEEAST